MRWLPSAVGVAALLGIASAQDPDSKQVVDAETGFTFGQYVSDQGISFRVAIPDPAPATGGYDAVLQIAAPNEIGWAGFAWGGSMTYNPLAIVWKNGNSVTLSSRFAFGYYVPPAYPNATYTVLATGTHVNATHWQVTAKCSGCTQWGDDDIGVTTLDPTQQNPLAYAFSTVPPDTPASNTSAFGIHDSIGHWYHDFQQGTNPGFAGLVSKNSEGPGSGSSTKTTSSSSAAGGSTGKPSTSTTKTTVTPPKPTTTRTVKSTSSIVSKPTPPKPTKPTISKPSWPPRPTKTLKPTTSVKPPHSPPFPFPISTPKPTKPTVTPVRPPM